MRERILRILEGKEGERESALLFGFAVLVCVLTIVGWWFWLRPVSIVADDSSPIVSDSAFRHPLTGERSDNDIAMPFVAAVSIDHAGDAGRPTGIEDAFMVFEMPVEGNITRWLAFFDLSKDVPEIGPVRSARSYFVDYARQGTGNIFAHVGGSPEALDDLKTANTLEDINEYFYASTFWRSKQRSAPHNVFTSTSRLREQISEDNNAGGFMPIAGRLKEDILPIASSRPCFLVTFGGGNGYDVKWCYRPETNDFVRSMNGVAEKTKNWNVLTASQIIILQTDVKTIDDVGRKRIKTTGRNQAILLQDGVYTHIAWEKISRGSPLLFSNVIWSGGGVETLQQIISNRKGEPVALRPGATWIEVVDSEWPVLWSPDDEYHETGSSFDISVYSQ